MKPKYWVLFAMLACLALIAAACAAPPETGGEIEATATEGEQAAPQTSTPTDPVAEDTQIPPTGGRAIQVEAASVQVGVGSPIPVEVQIAGTWPDLCAQLQSVEQQVRRDQIEISILASEADPQCRPDNLGLPFSLNLPLNMIGKPMGTYHVSVNGFETELNWEMGGEGEPAASEAAGELRPFPVEAVRVEIGVGSPIPVIVVVEGSWPDPCAQVAQIEQSIEGSQVEISLLASAAQPDCPPETEGLPFRIALPLNMVELPVGPYSVAVNGVETTFEWNAQPGATPPAEGGEAPEPPGDALGAFIWQDGNVWVVEGSEAPQARQLTTDATPAGQGSDPQASLIQYSSPALSSDRRMVAFRRDEGVPSESGMEFSFALWVYDLTSGESRQVLDEATAGFAWRPGTHMITYGQMTDPGYFPMRGETEPSLAKGIMLIDLDAENPQPEVLVEPEGGYHLVTPVWSPDGFFLGFDEVLYMEGRGNFAYYRFEDGEYIQWEEAIGNYSWSPDASKLAYDRMTYMANGSERIYERELENGSEQQVSPEEEGRYAVHPVYSPEGDRIAYLSGQAGVDGLNYTLFVLDLASGEARELGQYESVLGLSWTPDGNLIFRAGSYGEEKIYVVSAEDGEVRLEH